MTTKNKEIPEGLWLAFGLADPDRLKELEKKYGSLGGEKEDFLYLYDTDAMTGDYVFVFGVAMEYFQHRGVLDTWDERIATDSRVYHQKLREFDTVKLSLRDFINGSLQDLKIAPVLIWEDEELVFKGRAKNLAGKIVGQVIKEIRKPRAWQLCDHCGIPFPIKRRGTGRYCSANCRVLAYKKRKREEAKK